MGSLAERKGNRSVPGNGGGTIQH